MPTKATFSVLFPSLVGALATVCFAPDTGSTARAGDAASYTVPAGEGYGIVECLRAGSDCGRGMANSWCEAHGHARAIAYGSAGDVTGAIKASDKVFQVATGDIIIRCAD